MTKIIVYNNVYNYIAGIKTRNFEKTSINEYQMKTTERYCIVYNDIRKCAWIAVWSMNKKNTDGSQKPHPCSACAYCKIIKTDTENE